MSLRNKATLLLINQIDTVKVTYGPYLEGHSKLYSFKSKKGQFQSGDYAVVVDTDGKYKIVQVHSIDEVPVIDPFVNYEYKWLVDKIDLSGYKKCLDAEDQLMSYVRNAERTKLQKEVVAEVQAALPAEAVKAIEAVLISE